MNESPENQNFETGEEISTIFSNPLEHKQKQTKNQNKKRIKIIIASVLAVAVLFGGTFAVIKLIPKKEDPTEPTLEEITVLNIETDDVKSVTVENENGSFKFNSSQEKNGDNTVTVWLMDGYTSDLTNSYAIESLITSATDVSAIREIDSKTLKECGLDSPEINVNINANEKITLSVGKKSPDNSGVYVKTSKDDKIYLVADALDEILNITALDMANTDDISPLDISEKYSEYYEGETLSSFDDLTIFGENLSQKVVVEMNSDKMFASYVPYVVTSPINRIADNVDDLFDMFIEGIAISSAYSLDVLPKTIKSLGLDSPDFAVTARFGDYKYTYKFKKQSDGNYAVVGNDSKMVKGVLATDLEFLSFKTSDFYSGMIFLQSIDDISNLTIKNNGKTHSFDIKSSDDEQEEDYLVNYNDNKIDSANFQSFYQLLLLLSCNDFTVDNLNSAPEISVVFKYNNNQPSTTIDFIKANATNYQYSIDGNAMGKISSSQVNKILRNLDKLISGEEIIVN